MTAGEFIGFLGTKGTMVIKDSTLTYTPQDTRPQPESYSIYGWPEGLREQYLEDWHAKHPLPTPLASAVEDQSETFTVPPGYSDLADHQANFFNAVRSRKRTVENEEFGNNAAIGCHLANYSYFNKTVATWDAAGKRSKGKPACGGRRPVAMRVRADRSGFARNLIPKSRTLRCGQRLIQKRASSLSPSSSEIG